MKRSDPNRITDEDALNEAKDAAAYLVKVRGVRGTAAWLGWTMADVSRYSNGKWNEIKLYPEQLETLRLARDLAEADDGLIQPIKDALKELTSDVGRVTGQAMKIRRMIKKVTR